MEAFYFNCLLLFLLFCVFLYGWTTRNHGYWRKKKIPHLKPSIFYGNYYDYITLKKTIGQYVKELCEQFPHDPYIGTYFGTDPALLVQDIETIKLILIKDFNHFTGREASNYSESELITQCLVFRSANIWKVERKYLSPLLSISKLNNMFYLIKESSDKLEKFLERETKISHRVNIKSLITRYTLHTICSCGFGIDAGVMEDDVTNNLFVMLADEIFSKSKWRCVKTVWRSMWPYTFYKLGLQLFPSELHSFFYNIYMDVTKNRDTKSKRHDFVDLILSWKKFDKLTLDDDNTNIKVDDNVLVTECILFFAAGFETTSLALTFTLFELAKNKDAQKNVIAEVDAYFQKNEEITYKCVSDTPYLEASIYEALRMYPIVPVINREVTADYTFPSGLHVEKGIRIHIPVTRLHTNPDFFSEPHKYRPERFIGEEKNNVIPFSFLPFGEGPRICLGRRLAKMIMIAAAINIFKRYTIELAEDMSPSLNFVPGALVNQIDGDVYLKLVPR